jgi:uncharacterized protein YndB with AHSA1/START domain
MTTATIQAVRVQRTLSAAPERVFDAWLDPVALGRFMRPGGEKRSADAVTDPRVGGRFIITMLGEETVYPHTGEYLEIDRPRKLVFTWYSKATAMSKSTVTVELKPVAGGKTELTLTHVGLPQDQMQNHNGGWTAIMELLESALRA